LSEKNLSNLTPHRLYSAFYYSHPTMLEREQALRAVIHETSGDQRALP
jgi:STE24 endopeptidase